MVAVLSDRVYAVWQVVAGVPPEHPIALNGGGFYFSNWPIEEHALRRIREQILEQVLRQVVDPGFAAGKKMPRLSHEQVLVTFMCPADDSFPEGPDMTGLELARRR